MDQICRNAAGVTKYNSPSKIHLPHLRNALSNEKLKGYFRDTSYDGWPIVRRHPERLCLSRRHGFASLQSVHSRPTSFCCFRCATFCALLYNTSTNYTCVHLGPIYYVKTMRFMDPVSLHYTSRRICSIYESSAPAPSSNEHTSSYI